MEKYSSSSNMNAEMVDKIADIFAQVIAKKTEISTTAPSSIMTDSVLPHHMLPRQYSLPSLSMPYMPRTPAKESYTLEDFQCKYCHRPFFSKRELTKHTESVHFIEVYKPTHWCSSCTTSFSSNKELTKHLQFHHGESDLESGTTCKICHLIFQHPRLLANHMTIYHIPSMSCSICSKGFSDVLAVWQHLISEHKIVPKEIRCNLCDKVFGMPEEYNEHCRGDHAFPCMLCEKSVASTEKLQEHLEDFHKKHFCADCAEIFNDFESFVQHYITNEKCSLDPYKLICRYCSGIFPNLKLLFKHLCLDSFKCVFCESSSISCKTFQNHLEQSHHTSFKYVSLPMANEEDKAKSEPETQGVTQHRLVPTIVSDYMSTEPPANRETNGNTASYIHNLIQVNENLLNSKPLILSKYSSTSTDSSGSQPSAMKIYNNPEHLIKYLQNQAQNLQSSMEMSTSSENIKSEPVEMDCSQDSPETKSPPGLHHHQPVTKTDSSDSLLNPTLSPSGSSQQPNESFSSLELEEDGSDRGDLDDIEGDGSSESRRNSLRQKYQQLSISRMGRRSSKSLTKLLCKSKVEELSENNPIQSAVASAMSSVRSSFSCQRCSKTFVNRSLLSRHWGSATKCYICSKSMCDLKVLNEHMKSEHSEYT